MKYLEINAAGSFDNWNPSKLEELKNSEISNELGQKLLFENKNIRIWEVELAPQERLPFRMVNLDFNWVSLTAGIALSRYANGKIVLINISKGASYFIKASEKPKIYDLENIGDDVLFFHITEYKEQIIEKYQSSEENLTPTEPK